MKVVRPKTAAQWRKWLPSISDRMGLNKPATEKAIRAVERAFRIKLHDDLRTLLSASDGVLSPAGYWLVWPTELMLEENRSYRTRKDFASQYMPFDHLFFIGEAPNGDLFFYPVSADGNARHRNDIFEWGHETDQRMEAAMSLQYYIKGVVDGSIEV